ncbi:hypothetical protein L3X38_010172 [Prunus dulcis]|uniref:Uncharacterized protein n=1 Tax=Prunus dulcis TaxID=3755 RepID=A0AAD4WH84_PRUDU|nr:hypothetical protein L3X38_010172 [Prunus dulcis]
MSCYHDVEAPRQSHVAAEAVASPHDVPTPTSAPTAVATRPLGPVTEMISFARTVALSHDFTMEGTPQPLGFAAEATTPLNGSAVENSTPLCSDIVATSLPCHHAPGSSNPLPNIQS